MKYGDLKADQVYALTRDVVNPNGDGRFKRQANMARVWPKGTRVIARERTYEHGDGLTTAWFAFEWVDYPYGRLYEIPVYGPRVTRDVSRCEQGDAILAALEPVEEDYEAFCARIDMSDYCASGVLERLCEKGIVTREQIEAENNRWMEDDDG